jgi:hypothetical protein
VSNAGNQRPAYQYREMDFQATDFKFFAGRHARTD